MPLPKRPASAAAGEAPASAKAMGAVWELVQCCVGAMPVPPDRRGPRLPRPTAVRWYDARARVALLQVAAWLQVRGLVGSSRGVPGRVGVKGGARFLHGMGQRHILAVPPGLAFCTQVFACHQASTVPPWLLPCCLLARPPACLPARHRCLPARCPTLSCCSPRTGPRARSRSAMWRKTTGHAACAISRWVREVGGGACHARQEVAATWGWGARNRLQLATVDAAAGPCCWHAATAAGGRCGGGRRRAVCGDRRPGGSRHCGRHGEHSGLHWCPHCHRWHRHWIPCKHRRWGLLPAGNWQFSAAEPHTQSRRRRWHTTAGSASH